jgi:hypothetical protein
MQTHRHSASAEIVFYGGNTLTQANLERVIADWTFVAGVRNCPTPEIDSFHRRQSSAGRRSEGQKP